MSYYTWGSSMDIHIARNSYKPAIADVELTEIQLLPDGSGNISTVLQQGGRKRKKISFRGYAVTKDDYDDLLADYYAKTSRTFTDYQGDSMTAIISTFDATRVNEWYEYDITFMEV